MANLVSEMNNFDFGIYIGGPLQAAIQAQTTASIASVKFIQEVGFEDDKTSTTANPKPKQLRYVDFVYSKSVPNPDFGKTAAQIAEEGKPTDTDVTNKFLTSNVTIKVPFLTMLVVPAMTIKNMTIDFNARLTSIETANVSSEFAASAEFEIKKIKLKAAASYKRTSSTGSQVEKSYNINVHVEAFNDEMPPGLERILTMLEDSITSVNT